MINKEETSRYLGFLLYTDKHIREEGLRDERRMSEVLTKVRAIIYPTEDEEKVIKAVRNIFPFPSFEIIQEADKRVLLMSCKGRSALQKFRDMLRHQRIRSSAKLALLRGVRNKSIRFCLNKQVAYVRKVSFSEPVKESPLGPIEVEVECEDPEALIEWITGEK